MFDGICLKTTRWCSFRCWWKCVWGHREGHFRIEKSMRISWDVWYWL